MNHPAAVAQRSSISLQAPTYGGIVWFLRICKQRSPKSLACCKMNTNRVWVFKAQLKLFFGTKYPQGDIVKSKKKKDTWSSETICSLGWQFLLSFTKTKFGQAFPILRFSQLRDQSIFAITSWHSAKVLWLLQQSRMNNTIPWKADGVNQPPYTCLTLYCSKHQHRDWPKTEHSVTVLNQVALVSCFTGRVEDLGGKQESGSLCLSVDRSLHPHAKKKKGISPAHSNTTRTTTIFHK